MRYENVTDDVIELFREVKTEYFPELRNANILLLFDNKKRKSNGKIILARIKKADDLVKQLTLDNTNGEGYDYIIFIDKIAFTNIEKNDRIKLLRHELRHTFVDNDDDDNPFKLVPHDVEDFAQEIELNSSDINWSLRVADLTEAIYEQNRDNN